MIDSQRIAELAIFLLVTLAAEILGTIGGFGSSVFFVSISHFFFDMQTVLALTGLLHVFSNIFKIGLFRKHIDWRLTMLIGFPSVALTFVGALLTSFVNMESVKLVLGIFLLALAFLFLLAGHFKLSPTNANCITGGALAGFLAGFAGTGGAIRGLVLTAFDLEKQLFAGTSAAIDLGVDVTRTIVYAGNNFFRQEHIVYVPILIAASFLGSYLGKKLMQRIPQQAFRLIVLILIGAMGAILILEEVA
jgi:uncharacterized membrane protein YfcA